MTALNQFRLPAEWEPVDAVLLAWPHANTDWAYMLDEVRECYRNIIEQISKRAKVLIIGPEEPDCYTTGTIAENVFFIPLPTNDTWTRDYGPITMVHPKERPALLDFMFNGWGLKFASDEDNRATRRLFEAGVFSGPHINNLGFILEGGGIDSDGQGTILTTSECLLSPNRNAELTRDEIEKYLKEKFNAERILWLEHGGLEGDDTDSHVDTLARFAPPGDIIFFSGCAEQEDAHYHCLNEMKKELAAMRTIDDRPYHLMELPIPDPVHDPENGARLPATYANFLYLNGAVLLPVYNQPMKDLMAIQVLQAGLPDYEIIPIDCSALIRQHGSLHCATMQLPPNVF